MSTASIRSGRPLPLPWLDRRGRVCPWRASAFLALLAPGIWIAWQWATGMLGPEPVKEAIHGTGLWAVRFLLASLAITPLRWLSDLPQLPYLRRQLGVGSFCYAFTHLLLFVLDQNLDLPKAVLEIVQRFYLTIGFVALLGLGALAWTSTDGWTRRLARDWKRLHRLAYPIGVLAILHFFLQSKADVSEPVFVSGLFLWLMLWRLLPDGVSRRPLAAFLLAPAAALGAAGVEYAWYALATNIPAGLVLAANLDLTFGPRPAVWVGITSLGLALLVTLRRVTR